ncbi:MAG TPA: histidine phosphatase family protein [Chloroflexia bacterium]|nr:histidine phosphatase family protein [Chloroflexia bacterium]
MTQLYLIRHGEAMGAVLKRFADTVGECGLTPRGRRQAEQLRDRLAATGEIAADVVITSTLPRARETAEILAPVWGRPLILDDELQELRGGAAEGLDWQEFQARYGKPNFNEDPFRPVAPGGESWGQFQLRIGTALRRVTREHAGHAIVIVCHGGVIGSSLLHFLGISPVAPRAFGLFTHNTAITHWEQEEHDGRLRWRLLSYNDAIHLRPGIRWAGVAAQPETGVDTPAVPLPTEPAPP